MADRNTENENARSGRAVTDGQPPRDGAHADPAKPEPKAYAAPDYREASVAGPAAGELTDYADEGEPSGGAQQGRDRTRSALRDTADQGPKTKARNREILQSGGRSER